MYTQTQNDWADNEHRVAQLSAYTYPRSAAAADTFES